MWFEGCQRMKQAGWYIDAVEDSTPILTSNRDIHRKLGSKTAVQMLPFRSHRRTTPSLLYLRTKGEDLDFQLHITPS
jgi:hypothetical protein